MVHSSDDSGLQAKFDEQADGLGLALEQPEERTKFFGLAFLMLDDAAVRTETADTEVFEEVREVSLTCSGTAIEPASTITSLWAEAMST